MSAIFARLVNRFNLRSLSIGLLPLLVLAHFGHHLMTALPIPLLPAIRADFELGYTEAGLVVSAFSLAYGIGQLPAGWLTDRVGARIMITVGISGIAAAGFLVGLAPSYIILLVLMALMGLAGGGYHPAAPPIIMAAVEQKNRSRALGLHTIGGGLSFFIAPLLAAAIVGVWGWRGAFITLAIPGVILGIIFYIVIGRISARRPIASQGSEITQPEEPGRGRRLISMMIMSTVVQAVMAAIVTFVPLFMVDHFGLSKAAAASFIALYYVPGLWVGPVGGHVADRVGNVPVLISICLLGGPVVLLLGLVPNVAVFGALLLSMGIIMYVRMPVSEAYIVGHTSPRRRSTVLGAYYFGTSEGAGILTPVIGFLIDRFGFQFAFTVSGAVALGVALLASIWLWGKRN